MSDLTKGIEDLQMLSMRGLPLGSIITTTMYLPNLEELYIESVPLQVIDLTNTSPKLKFAFIAETYLEKIMGDEFDIASLKTLYLQKNKKLTIFNMTTSLTPNLQQLFIWDSPIHQSHLPSDSWIMQVSLQ